MHLKNNKNALKFLDRKKYTTKKYSGISPSFSAPNSFFWQGFYKTLSDCPRTIYCVSDSVCSVINHDCKRWYHCPAKSISLFRNKRFMLDKMTQQNASKFAILLVYENQHSICSFSFRATLFFPLMNALVYVNIDQGIQ